MAKPRKAKRVRVEDVNIDGIDPLVTPWQLKADLPLTQQAAALVHETRQRIAAIITGRTRHRLLVVAGPCSIHDPDSALEYAARLADWRREFGDWFELVMRVYLEKPRTTVGWKGLTYDPYLDGSNRIDVGLRLGRELLLGINQLGVPCVTEYVDTRTPQYSADLVSLAVIGARTTESQVHRELASGLSMPVGIKNSTSGDMSVARDAIIAAASRHRFPGMDHNGRAGVVRTKGNRLCIMVLRGGHKPNFHPADIELARQILIDAGLPPFVIVDCSHGNSEKKHELQTVAWKSVIGQRAAGNEAIVGLALESNLRAGKQGMPQPGQMHRLEQGVSITDACISADTTEELLRTAHRELATSPQLATSADAPKRRPQGRRRGGHRVHPPPPAQAAASAQNNRAWETARIRPRTAPGA